MSEHEITCQQRDDLVENNQPVSVYSSLTNFVGGEILDPRLPGHTATTWCDEAGRPFLREILDAEGCRHWRIDRAVRTQHKPSEQQMTVRSDRDWTT